MFFNFYLLLQTNTCNSEKSILHYSMSTILRLIVVVLVFSSVTFPEKLSISALPAHSEALTSEESAILFQYLHRNKIEQLDQLMNRYRWFNGNVMVVKDHTILYQRSNGYANHFRRQPLTTESVFELASVSKQFTSVAVLMLYERGLLGFDDTLSAYIPELPYENITIRQLLHHTSGLPNYMWVLENRWTQDHMPSNEEMIEMLAAHQPYTFFRPGRRYSYSNTGYALLASVVERVSGQSFTDFMLENIFIPLGMHHTFTSVQVHDSSAEIPHVVAGHRQFRRGFRPNGPSIHEKVLGDKGIYSNLDDLFKWDQALYDGSLLADSTLHQAFEPLRLNRRWTFPYGFGFRIGNNSGEKYVYHHGLWEGFRTSFFRYIESGNSIVILNNANQQMNNQIIRQIERIIEGHDEENPQHQLALAIINSGLEDAESLYASMLDEEIIEQADAETLLEFSLLMQQINKPILASRIFHFYERHCLFEPAFEVAYIE
jgi:CubicO group peptidase (beta-lactamase class C family)